MADESPTTISTPSSEGNDEARGRQVISSAPRGQLSSRRPPPSPQSTLHREQHLVELLSNAAAEISSQRSENQKLKHENEALRSKLYAKGLSAKPGKKDSELTLTKQKLLEISLENHLAVEQITLLRKKVVDLEAQTASQAEEITHLKSVRRSPAKILQVRTRTTSPRHHVSEPKTHVKSIATSKQTPAARTFNQRVPEPSHHFDAMASVQQTFKEPQEAPRAPTDTKVYNELMINRLRRAIAPIPTKEEIGEVVHAMVIELQKSLRSRGTDLPLRKLMPCVYECGTRKLHLSVDSGRLVVKCGGGHVDFFEYLERSRLCTPRA